MSELRQLVGEYEEENRQLRAALSEVQTALTLVLTVAGKPDKNGRLVIAVPAAARKAAARLARVDMKWSSPANYLTAGGVRIMGTARNDLTDD